MNTHQITFRHTQLTCVEHNNELFVAMKPVVEGMGLAWQTQQRKLQSDNNRFCITLMVIQLPNDTQRREHIFIPLERLFGWMMTIHPSRVKPEIRGNVIAYQNECDRVLAQHFTKELHAETIEAKNKLNEMTLALFERNPQWPTILAAKSQGLTHQQTCELTGFKATSTIGRNLKRMAKHGLTPHQMH